MVFNIQRLIFRYHYGPYTYAFDNSVTELEQIGIISKDESYFAEGKKSIHYYPINNLLLDQYKITEGKALLAEYIIDTYSELSLEALLNDVYNSAPMLKIKRKEEEFGMGLMLREALDMNEFNGTIKISKAELIAARARRNKQINCGADKDYYAHLSTQYKELEDLRRRAEECQM